MVGDGDFLADFPVDLTETFSGDLTSDFPEDFLEDLAETFSGDSRVILSIWLREPRLEAERVFPRDFLVELAETFGDSSRELSSRRLREREAESFLPNDSCKEPIEILSVGDPSVTVASPRELRFGGDRALEFLGEIPFGDSSNVWSRGRGLRFEAESTLLSDLFIDSMEMLSGDSSKSLGSSRLRDPRFAVVEISPWDESRET